jgi:probable rRNA maturation factor
MVNILIKSDSRYRVNKDKIKSAIIGYIENKKLKGSYEISVSIVGDRMMRTLNKKFRDIDKTTDVLSFPLMESKSQLPFDAKPDGVLRLGDVVVSFPQAIEHALAEHKTVDEVINFLVLHGMDHLFGIHHD